MSDDFPLAAEFPPTTASEWRKLVEAALKGAAFEKRLVSQTYDGIAVQPLYPRAPGAAVVAGRPAVPWQVIQRVDHPDARSASQQARQDLEEGAVGLAIVFAGASSARGFGIGASNGGDLGQTLEGVMLDLISLRIETAPFGGRPVAEMIKTLVTERRIDATKLAIDFGLDPIGDMARSGHTIHPWPELCARAGATVKDLKSFGFGTAHLLRADGRAVHEAAGSEAQELAFVLAAGVAYLRLLESSGFTLEEARQRVSFLMAADADEFLTIAKFRALRKLWARVEEASGLTPKPAFVAAETAWRMMSRRDPYVNMLRTTIAVTAAGVGGADAISALPFTIALGLPDAFARRVARNMQLILLEESNLCRVRDPAAGSGGIEAMTGELTKAAWLLFQEIEAAGGAAAAIEHGLFQMKVATTRAERLNAVARRKDALTGVSDFPDLGELAVKVLDAAPTAVAPARAKETFEKLPQLRLSEPFEALRDASDRMLAKTGARPKVFLANLGLQSDFTTRSTFANSFYGAGGVEAITNDGFKDQGEMIAAFKASGAKLACLCSSDKIYANEAVAAAKALAAAGAVVQLAGRPGENEANWKQAGIQAFIYAGCDTVATLKAAHDILGVK
jgi:methylmalonyl-CoA mutase